MAVLKLKLVRPRKHVVLEMTEPGLPLTKGSWRRLSADSNSKLQYESGEWENWILGSPGGGRNIRLYDPSDTKSAFIKEFVDGTTEGDTDFLIDTFGGDFGGDPCRWFRL